MAVCCVSPQCCTSRLQLDSPAPNKLLPLESMSSPAVSYTGAHDPSPSPPQLPPRSEPQVSRCESCLYRLCGCQGVQVPSNRSSTDKEESSLDIDLNDPVLLQALDDCINRGSRFNAVPPGNTASTDVNERLKDVDFISMFFRNYQRTPKEESIPEELDSPLPLNAHHPSPVALDPLCHPEVDVESSSPVFFSQLSDVSSSLPSSFQLDGIQKRLFAPANSPASNVERSLPTTTDSEHSYRSRVPVHLQRQFAIMFDHLPIERNRPNGHTPVGNTLSGGDSHFRRRTCPYTIRRIRRRQDLGSRPPCLGQEQSPIRGISCTGQESTSPVVPALRATALTPDDGDLTLVVTPPQTYTSPAAGTLPTVKRGLYFSSRSQEESSESEALLRATPRRVKELSGKRCASTSCSPALPGIKNSSEKVRSWLKRMQDSSTDAVTSVPFTPVTAQSPLSSGQVLRSRKRKVQRLHLFPDQKYKRPAQFCGNLPLEGSSKACGNETPDEDRISPQTEENLHSSRSSGFLADRSSTTWSSLRTSSTADRHTPSLPDQQQRSSWNNEPGDPLIPVVTPEPSDRPESPTNIGQNNHSPDDAGRQNNSTYHTFFDDLLNESSSNNPRCDQDDLQIIYEEESSADDIHRLGVTQSPSTTRRRHILMKSLKQMGQHLRKKTVKDARITTLAVL